jgi:ribosomal protein L16 Arg81 hydroxylase
MGKKRWRIFPPTFPYPLSTHTSQDVQSTAPSTPVLDCVLETGDVLYIPRGWWHQAIPLDGASFHLSVGVYVPTMLEYVLWACQRYLPAEIVARKGISGTHLTELTKDLAAVAQAVTAAIANPSHVAEFKRSLAELQKPPSAIDLTLLLNIGAAALDDSTVITLNHSYAIDCARSEVAVNGIAITLNDISRPVVKALAERTSLTLAELCEAARPVSAERVKALVLEFARMDVVGVKRYA